MNALPHRLPARAQQLVQELALQPHPEGGFFREVYRSPLTVQPADGRSARSALTTIDFLLARGQFSAWHRVRSDEVWHLLEGEGLRLWLIAPPLSSAGAIDLRRTGAQPRLRHVVPAHWWQAAEPLGEYALAGATVGPGFDFADFAFGRDHAELRQALRRLAPGAQRLL